MGAYKRDPDENFGKKYGQEFEPCLIIVHPDYDNALINLAEDDESLVLPNDVALVELERDAIMTE